MDNNANRRMPPGEDINKLLKEWKLECISSHLQAEKIDLEILEMIKLHHIRPLLSNFPLGIQIRFEYNLEQWRTKIGKPLYGTHRCCCQGNEFGCQKSYGHNYFKAHNECSIGISNEYQNQQQQHPRKVIIVRQDLGMPHAVGNEVMVTPPETPMTHRSLASTHGSSGQSTFSHTSSSGGGDGGDDIANNSPEHIPFTLKPLYHISETNLRDIILDCRPEGPMLMKSYAAKNGFNPRERRSLMNIIVNYFMRNNQKFDLQISYLLENAILKLFPNENLEMYRKGKRGSLYCKYMNYKHSLLSTRKRKKPTDDGTETGSDLDSVSQHDHSMTDCDIEENESVNVINEAMDDLITNGSDAGNHGVEHDASAKDNFTLVEPKLEVDTEIPIRTAYRLHREVIILKTPFSYKDFLEKACNAYNIPNVEEHYLVVNDCEISEHEFKNVIMQYYKLATFVVEIKQRSNFLRRSDSNSGDSVSMTELREHTTIRQDPNHLPSAEEIRNLTSLLPIIAHVDLGKPLENKHRNAIAKAVVEETLRVQPDRCIKRQEFMILAHTVCQAFPTEEETTYFIPAKPKAHPKGKLWSAFVSKRTFLVQSGVAKKRYKRRKNNTEEDNEETQSTHSQQTEAEEPRHVDFSENTSMDWDYLMVKWMESHDKRWQELVKEKLTPSEYMERYSILRNERGITLIEIDVKNRYPQALTIENWLNIYAKVFEKAKGIRRKLGNSNSIIRAIEEAQDEKHKAGLSLLLIPYIIPSSGRKSELITSKATKTECQERFMKGYGSLDELRSDPKPADLQIRFVHSHHSVVYAEFSISGFLFQCSDLMEALSFLFHYMLAMNIRYPQTCLQVWQFIQLAIFHIEVEKDKMPYVESTIVDLHLN
ncbi:uncharacterized protein LOC101887300 [Musca domestica]|uniref:Uncharacterized protein LOC101887300 n=1 Tax=Musca domestica TaxID=7370 RepID=A0A1I8NER4_MUSDO|nr:uncharacterized protein LOC101887300 [Musca domestica]